MGIYHGVFFQGIDIMQHYFWEFMAPQSTGTEPPHELLDGACQRFSLV